MKTKAIVLSTLILLCLTSAAFGQTKAAHKTVFSSVYTSFEHGCKDFSGEGGTDGYSICRGPARYQIRVYYSAVTTQINAEIRGKDDNFPLATLSLDYDPGKTRVEWRLADGKPFAVILRTPVYGDPTGDDTYFGRVIGQELTVKGLKGFDTLAAKVDAKKPGANIEARTIADKAYTDDR
jgi:hypothetical protein